MLTRVRTLPVNRYLPMFRQGQADYPEPTEHLRPRTFGECKRTIRTDCPFVSCRHHLGIEVLDNGSLFLTREDPTSTRRACSLDVANSGPKTLDEVGEILGVTRTRVQQIEQQALAKVRAHAKRMRLRDLLEWVNEMARKAPQGGP